jgi:hypothetical protein
LGGILGFLVLLLVLTPALHAAIEDHAADCAVCQSVQQTQVMISGGLFVHDLAPLAETPPDPAPLVASPRIIGRPTGRAPPTSKQI